MSDTLERARNLSASLRPKADATKDGAVKTDPHFVEDKKVARVIETAIKAHRHVWLWGHTSTGKSSLVQNICGRLGVEAEIFSCDGNSSTEDLIGKVWKNPADNSLVVLHGAAIRAYEQGKILLVEEIDHAEPDILSCLHRILEHNQDFYTMNVGQREVIRRHPQFCCIATANSNGYLDMSHIYPGIKQMNAAFLRRFTWRPQMKWIDPTSEQDVLVKKTGIDPESARKMVTVAQRAREGLEQGELYTVVGTADLLNWAEAMVMMKFNGLEAAELTFLASASGTDGGTIREFITDVIS